MELNDRQNAILQKINAAGQVRVAELAKELFFSEMTIRRDLKMMEKEGFLKRTHGGAVENVSEFQYPTHYRMEINKEQKKHLAEKAIPYLSDNQVIFLNSSSTLMYILPHLPKFKNLQVITNSVLLLSYLAKIHVPCCLTGGRYNEIEQCLTGRQAEAFLRGVNPDIAFLSCEALGGDGRVTESDQDLAEIAKVAVEKSKATVLLMDRSKVGNVSTYDICSAEQLTDVILF